MKKAKIANIDGWKNPHTIHEVLSHDLKAGILLCSECVQNHRLHICIKEKHIFCHNYSTVIN
jgi:hypothetical protein